MDRSNLQIKALLSKKLPTKLKKLLKVVGRLADELNLPVYIVGGFVRDLLLCIKNLDIDIVVEGDGVSFARALKEAFSGSELQTHERFRTAVLTFADGFSVDIATARREYYPLPAHLPVVEPADIKSDLYRRDFTINALAIRLNYKSFGELVDYYDGLSDLCAKKIRAMHKLSFIEDPTRIFRAIRYEQRYKFKIEGLTMKWLKAGLNAIEKLTAERLRNELILILKEEEPSLAIKRMWELKVTKAISPEAKLDKHIYAALKRIKAALYTFRAQEIEAWLVYFLVMFSSLKYSKFRSLYERLRLGGDELYKLKKLPKNWKQLINKLNKPELKCSQIYECLQGLPLEALIAGFVLTDSNKIRRRIKLFIGKLSKVKLSVTGDDLLSLGYTKGPAIGKALNKLLAAKIDAQIKTKRDELRLAKQLKDRL